AKSGMRVAWSQATCWTASPMPIACWTDYTPSSKRRRRAAAIACVRLSSTGSVGSVGKAFTAGGSGAGIIGLRGWWRTRSRGALNSATTPPTSIPRITPKTTPPASIGACFCWFKFIPFPLWLQSTANAEYLSNDQRNSRYKTTCFNDRLGNVVADKLNGHLRGTHRILRVFQYGFYLGLQQAH